MILESLEESVAYIRQQSNLKPKMGIVLGSGLGAFVKELKLETSIPYDEIPSFKGPSVEGHQGRLILGYRDQVPVAVLQGRVHFYEGHNMSSVVYPVRTLAMLGIEMLLLTNSAGGLDPQMSPGDFMLIDDHINLMGDNPLKGPNIAHLGPRFPDMSEPYDQKLTNLFAEQFAKLNTKCWRGTYCGVSGPTYETPAEVRYLRLIGGKAVGMSTVPEAIAGNHLGLRVCALSCITNLASGLSRNKLSHEEVTETAKAVEGSFCRVMNEFISAF